MPLMSLDFPPGIWRDDTQYRAEGKWYDCDKMRFRNGRPEMIGGWRRIGGLGNKTTTIPGTMSKQYAQQMRPTGLGAAAIRLAGTTSGLYWNYLDAEPVTLGTGSVIALTVEDFSFTLGNNPFTTDGSGYLIFNGMGKLRMLDSITISGAAGFGGVLAGDINQTYQVNYLFSDGTVWAGNATPGTRTNVAGPGGGAACVVQVTGSGFYNYWTFGAYGQDVVACSRNGAILYLHTGMDYGPFYLQEASATYPGAPVDIGTANQVPTASLGIAVGKDNSIIAFGCTPLGRYDQDLAHVRWSDQENPADWEPREDNTAGGFQIPWGTKIIGWVQTKKEILIWTDTSLVSMRWVGDPYYYSFEKVGDNVSLMSFRSAVAYGDAVYWMGLGQFYRYDGAITPIPCSVIRYVFNDMRAESNDAVFGGLNPEFNEIWWFYVPSSNSAITNYVTYNYVENCWAIGTLTRTCWDVLPGQNKPNIYSAAAGFIILQEYLYADHDSTTASNIAAYIESGDMDLGEGDRFQNVTRLIPDHATSGAAGTVTCTLKGRNYPLETPSTLATVTTTAGDRQKDLRARRRQFSWRWSSSGNDFKWILGRPRVDVQPDGGK